MSQLRVLVDCANGAATAEAPELFRSLGVQATFIHVSPDGKNINEGCGALHPDTLGKTVAESHGQFDLGVTFDGDADRALFCDAGGRVVNGDGVLLAAARDLHAQGKLKADTVVSTTMSNMGLEIALKKSGIRMLRANVGDKYVLEEMLKTGATLGGEQSGHIIFRDGEGTTGDGLLTALRLMDIVVRSGRQLAELVGDLKVFPQKIQNVRVREKVPFAQIPAVQSAIDAAERELNGNGRVVVRYSGTEALARVMVEAESEEKMLALDRRDRRRDSKSVRSVNALRRLNVGTAALGCPPGAARPVGVVRAARLLGGAALQRCDNPRPNGASAPWVLCAMPTTSPSGPCPSSAPALLQTPQTESSSPLDRSGPPAPGSSAPDGKSSASAAQ